MYVFIKYVPNVSEICEELVQVSLMYLNEKECPYPFKVCYHLTFRSQQLKRK